MKSLPVTLSCHFLEFVKFNYNEKIKLEEQEAVDPVAETTENYNNQRAAELYQLIIAEPQRRKSQSGYQDIQQRNE